eukprot:1166872-Prymnesium_polylepis.1
MSLAHTKSQNDHPQTLLLATPHPSGTRVSTARCSACSAASPGRTSAAARPAAAAGGPARSRRA